MTIRVRSVTGCAAGLLVLMTVAGWVTALGAQTTRPGGSTPSPLVVTSMTGKDLFNFYCAPCHGTDGKGNGPSARNLATKPSDLTTIAKGRGGTFPTEDVRALIMGAGSLLPAHVSDDMPVWDAVFRGLDRNDARNRVRVGNIADYIGSLQSTAK